MFYSQLSRGVNLDLLTKMYQRVLHDLLFENLIKRTLLKRFKETLGNSVNTQYYKNLPAIILDVTLKIYLEIIF